MSHPKAIRIEAKDTADNPLRRLKELQLDGKFAKRTQPVKTGQVLQMSWRVLVVGDGGPSETALWDQRAIEYWALQGYKYGLIFDLENTINFLAGDVFISNAAVGHVVPGERIDERAWRKMNPPSKVMAQLGIGA